MLKIESLEFKSVSPFQNLQSNVSKQFDIIRPKLVSPSALLLHWFIVNLALVKVLSTVRVVVSVLLSLLLLHDGRSLVFL